MLKILYSYIHVHITRSFLTSRRSVTLRSSNTSRPVLIFSRGKNASLGTYRITEVLSFSSIEYSLTRPLPHIYLFSRLFLFINEKLKTCSQSNVQVHAHKRTYFFLIFPFIRPISSEYVFIFSSEQLLVGIREFNSTLFYRR